MNPIVRALPSGAIAGIAATLAFRIANQPLSPIDWAMVVSLTGMVSARAARSAGNATAGQSLRVPISRAAEFAVKLWLVDLLRRLKLLSERDAEALRKRIKSSFIRNL